MKFVAIFLFAFSSHLLAAEMRTWTTAGGRTAKATLISKSEGSITIRLPDGTESEIEINKLSIEDQQFIKDWTPPEPKRPIYVPKDAAYFDESWYKVFLEKIFWTSAQKKAEKMEGHLVWIRDQATQDFIKIQAKGLRLWLGATDENVEGLWKWTDGEEMKFKNWKKDQPNNWGNRQHYLYIDSDGGWGDTGNDGGYPVGYIVQWEQ